MSRKFPGNVPEMSWTFPGNVPEISRKVPLTKTNVMMFSEVNFPYKFGIWTLKTSILDRKFGFCVKHHRYNRLESPQIQNFGHYMTILMFSLYDQINVFTMTKSVHRVRWGSKLATCFENSTQSSFLTCTSC